MVGNPPQGIQFRDHDHSAAGEGGLAIEPTTVTVETLIPTSIQGGNITQAVTAGAGVTIDGVDVGALHPNLTTAINTSWVAVYPVGSGVETTKLAQISGKGCAFVATLSDGSASAVTRIYIDGTVVWSIAANTAVNVAVQFYATLKITTLSNAADQTTAGGSVRGNYA